jgi:hypothetical protein
MKQIVDIHKSSADTWSESARIQMPPQSYGMKPGESKWTRKRIKY